MLLTKAQDEYCGLLEGECVFRFRRGSAGVDSGCTMVSGMVKNGANVAF